jgi:hypothetical protein
MLASGIATLLCPYLADHPALAFTRVHVVLLSVDLHTSFLKPLLFLPPMRTMLASGITTLLCWDLANHLAPAVCCVQGTVQFSSPKDHAQPVGLFVEVSVNCTFRGAGPIFGLPVKLATGITSTIM